MGTLRSSSWTRAAVAVGVVVAGTACDGDGSRAHVQSSGRAPVASSTAGAVGDERDRGQGRSVSLLYLRGTAIRRASPAHDRPVVDVHAHDVHAAPGSDVVAYVGGEGTGSTPDFLSRPVLHVAHLASAREKVLGPGIAPLWAPSGLELAYLEPVTPRRCDGEECAGKTRVVVYDVDAGSRRRVLGAGRWTLLAWAGSSVVVADLDHPSAAILAAPGVSPRPLPVAPSELWDVSPDGRWLVRSKPGTAAFVPLDGARPAGAAIPIPVGRGTLADGQWSPEGTTVAAVVLGRGAGTGSILATFSPERPQPRPVPGSAGAIGNVVWDARGEVVAAVASQGRRGPLSAVVCRPPGGHCRAVLAGVAGVRLLGLEWADSRHITPNR